MDTTRTILVAIFVSISWIAAGCSSGTPKVEVVQAPAPDPIARVKTMLTNYANGMPVTSEADSFADLATQVKQKDPAKGEIVEKGLAEIKANPGSAKAKANELLKKL
ncbi:MAG: hypothetical protein JF612_01175 [Planctomycetia bacterium]|jgi:hypothetical protein|nr:hypothetical protein [Planctomycetia bacterium]